MTDTSSSTIKSSTKFDRVMVAACVHFAKDFSFNPTKDDKLLSI